MKVSSKLKLFFALSVGALMAACGPSPQQRASETAQLRLAYTRYLPAALKQCDAELETGTGDVSKIGPGWTRDILELNPTMQIRNIGVKFQADAGYKVNYYLRMQLLPSHSVFGRTRPRGCALISGPAREYEIAAALVPIILDHYQKRGYGVSSSGQGTFLMSKPGRLLRLQTVNDLSTNVVTATISTNRN